MERLRTSGDGVAAHRPSPATRLIAGLLFPLHERLKGHDTVSILSSLEASQWLAPDELQVLQSKRLSALLSKVARTVPFYRDLFQQRHLDPAEFVSLESLSRLPIIDKSIIRTNTEKWTADGERDLIAHQTSGSSGEPLHFMLSRHRISFDIAAKWRATRWWGVDFGDREVVLWGSSLESGRQDRIREFRDHLFRSRLIPSRDLTIGRIDAIITELREFRPKMLFGYPSALARVAFRAIETDQQMNDIGLQVAFCTSEVLRPEWRAAIAAGFGCGVANEYGARDAGFIARECPAGGLHLSAEEVIVEVVSEDGTPLPPGVEGDILVTNLAGPEFPFIRYRTGDRGALSERRCNCGRGLPLIESVSGRANDGLVSASGGWVHGSAVNHVLRELPGLRAYRVTQSARDLVTISLLLSAPLPTRSATRLTVHIRRLLGESVHVKIETVGEISPEANGKFRHIVCLVDRPKQPITAPSVAGEAR